MKPVPLPRPMMAGQSATFDFELAAPTGGWKGSGRIRIQADKSLANTVWIATFNSESIVPTSDVTEPFPVPYPSMLAKPDELAAWKIPAGLASEGGNRFSIMLKSEESLSVQFVDLAWETDSAS